MAKQIEGVYDNLLACAKQEFLAHGYTGASLRRIAQEAGTSTNSVYVRFHDKGGLFRAIVKPAADGLIDRFVAIQESFHAFDMERQKKEVGIYSANEMLNLVDYIYDNLSEFQLLLDAANGTEFENFVDRLVAIEEEYTWKWMEITGARLDPNGPITKDFYHMVVSSYFQGIFEVVRHRMDKEDAKRYISLLGKYHHAGFFAISEGTT